MHFEQMKALAMIAIAQSWSPSIVYISGMAMETIETHLGLLLALSIAQHFTSFPLAIVGAMILLVGIEMVKFARDMC